MASARNFMSTDDLWQDYTYHRREAAYWERRIHYERSRYGYVPTGMSIALNAAMERAKASYGVLCKRRHGLRHADMSAQLAVEGYSR